MVESIDIIIPVYEPDSRFERELMMLSRQILPFEKLIVIHTMPDEDGAGSSEKIEECIARFVEPERTVIKHIPKDEFDHAGTRRMAVELSRADAFLCMTDDAVPFDEHLTERLVLGLNRQGAAICYARQIPGSNSDESERYAREFNYPEKSSVKGLKDIERLGIKIYFASNVCAAYRRSVYDEVGGFVPFAVFNEDMLFAAAALKAGYLIYYDARARVIHSHNYSAMMQLRRNFDNGMSQAMHPEVFDGLSSESEGLKFVGGTLKHLRRSGHSLDIPGLIIKSGFKYVGFRLGKSYRKLPGYLTERLSSNPGLARRALGSGEDKQCL